MILVNIIQIILYLLLIPFGLGMFFSRGLSKETKTFGRVYVFGFMTELAVSEMVFLLFYFLKMRFTPFAATLAVVLFVASAIAVVINKKELKELRLIKTDYSFLVLVAITLFAIVMRNLQGINDGDDAFVLGAALTTKTTDYFYTKDFYTGVNIYSTSYLRHFLAANPMFIAFLSKVTFVHPTILAHRVLGSLYIAVRSVIMYDAAELLFDKDENKKFRSMFASLVLFISIWDFHSFNTDSTFFLTRTWQGKAMFCGLLIPLVIELMLMIGKESIKRIYAYVFLAIMCASAVFMTPAAMFMYPLLVGVQGICLGTSIKKPKIILYSIISMIPMALFVFIYWRFCR